MVFNVAIILAGAIEIAKGSLFKKGDKNFRCLGEGGRDLHGEKKERKKKI